MQHNNHDVELRKEKKVRMKGKKRKKRKERKERKKGSSQRGKE
jgi:hypothetical protein